MSGVDPLRIAILAHSTNPRGGVVHALEVADALVRLGHQVVVHAPDVNGRGFFRSASCETVAIAAAPAGPDTTAMVEIRAAEFVRYFEQADRRRFDVFHAQDGISGNALATLQERGLVARFARTVHHVDQFRDPRLGELQARAIVSAGGLFVVSRMWRDHLRERFGRPSTVVGNGVDATRFSPARDGNEDRLRRRFGIGAGPLFLSIGGVEERKNTIRILEAFVQVRRIFPAAQLVVAGGASVLDHSDYQRRFADALAATGLPREAVIETGPIAHAELPPLYRVADTLVFPSVKEGFGLVVLEAMASGIPVVTSRIAPFTEHLGEADVVWCDPFAPTTIADAMIASLTESVRTRLIPRGRALTADYHWDRTAAAHLPVYRSMRERAYA